VVNRNPALDRADFPVPQSVLEAGGEPSSVLLAAIKRRIDQMTTGHVLEVASLTPNASLDAVVWCYVTGNRLVALLTEDGGVRFWIRKR
jgi:TusA-related sulfurtransferase